MVGRSQVKLREDNVLGKSMNQVICARKGVSVESRLQVNALRIIHTHSGLPVRLHNYSLRRPWRAAWFEDIIFLQFVVQ